MNALFAKGHIVDAILVFMAIEAVILALLNRQTRIGISGTDLAANFCAGAFLLLALKFALSEAGAHWIALCLTGALVSHAFDLRRRWRS